MIYDLFLDILKCAVAGDYYYEEIPVECFSELLRIANNHKVLPMILDSISMNHCTPKDLVDEYKLLIKGSIFSQTVISEKHLEVYRSVSNNNILPVVVKGVICKHLYPKPELRASSDEDWIVSDAKFELCKNHLLSLQLEPCATNMHRDYESSFLDGSGLRIDLHNSFFSTDIHFYDRWNKVFQNCDNNMIFVEFNGVKIKTLSPTYHLIYLVLHALKHFIHSGVGIRQICDIGFYARHYYEGIDWETFISELKELKAEKFAFCIFEICRKIIGIIDFKITPEIIDVQPLLSDVLRAGIYGSSSKELSHSSAITISAVTKNEYSKIKWLFPSAEKMALKYSYVERMPLLLPVAWAHKFIDYFIEIRKTRNNNPIASLKIGNERVKLLKKYGIL